MTHSVPEIYLKSLRTILSVILFCFLLFYVEGTALGHSNSIEIEKLQKQLVDAKGREKITLLSQIMGLYQISDTTKSFEYFKKIIQTTDQRGYNFEEFNVFNYLIGIYNRKARYKQSIVVLKKALQIAEKSKLPKAVGFAYSAIGRQYLMMNNYTEAKKYQTIALKQFHKIDYDYGIAVANERLGVINMIKNQFIIALKHFYNALTINQKLKLKHETGISLYHIGLIKLYLGDYEGAVNFILKSLKIWDERHEIANQWNSNELIGNVYIKMGNYKQALKYHRIALHIRQERMLSDIKRNGNDSLSPNIKLGLAYSYNNIAEVYLNLKQYDSAYYYAIKGLKIKTEKTSIASRNDVANSQSNLGNIYCALKKYDSAELMLQKAAQTYKATQNKSAYAGAMYGLGILNLHLKNYGAAKTSFLKGLSAARQVGDKYDVEKGYKHLSDLYASLQDYKSAFKYHQLYSQKKDSILNVENQNKIDELQIKYQIDKKEQRINNQAIEIRQKQKQVLLLVLIGILLAILLIFTIIFFSILKRQKEKMLRQKNENLQKELELKNKDLVFNVSKILTKNQVINKVAKQLMDKSENFKLSNRKLIKDIVRELNRSMDENGWHEFEIRFTQVHESFYAKLDQEFPDLTKTERKLCALLKLGMSSKEIATITLIRPESVDTARSRLRKKLGLSTDDSLSGFLKKL